MEHHVPESVPQYGEAGLPAFPWEETQAAGAAEGYPLQPYGMGDCRTFMDVPPLVHNEDGSTCINPDYEAVRRFSISALGRDLFADRSLRPDVTVAAGGRVEMQLTVEREEDGLGHTMINELLMLTDPEGGLVDLLVEIKNVQGDRTYTNAPVPAVNIFGTAQLNCCLPCPIMLYPNQSLIFTIHNRGVASRVVQIVARGKKFLPYHNMALAQEMERCWSNIQTTPFWLQLDGEGNEFGEVVLPAGVGSTARAQMSTPGGGFFELVWPRVQIVGAVPVDEIDVEVTDGRVGRRTTDGPIRLGAHYAVETKTVAGFPGNLFRAASACHCPPPTTIYKGNTRILHDFTNQSAAGGTIRLTYAGCMHYASQCPPQEDLDLVRKYGHGDAYALKKAQEEGDRVYLSFFDQNPLYADQAEDCAAPSAVAHVENPPAPAHARQVAVAVRKPIKIVSMHRPDKVYTGPGSVGALPWHYSWAVDEGGVTHLVIRDPVTNALVRMTTEAELAPFKPWLDMINQRSGLGSLGASGGGPRGDWESL